MARGKGVGRYADRDKEGSSDKAVAEAQVCPLCIELLDPTEKQFHPCPCGYQVCLFCYDRLKRECNNLCPGCRTEYGSEKDPFAKAPERVRQATQGTTSNVATPRATPTPAPPAPRATHPERSAPAPERIAHPPAAPLPNPAAVRRAAAAAAAAASAAAASAAAVPAAAPVQPPPAVAHPPAPPLTPRDPPTASRSAGGGAVAHAWGAAPAANPAQALPSYGTSRGGAAHFPEATATLRPAPPSPTPFNWPSLSASALAPPPRPHTHPPREPQRAAVAAAPAVVAAQPGPAPALASKPHSSYPPEEPDGAPETPSSHTSSSSAMALFAPWPQFAFPEAAQSVQPDPQGLALLGQTQAAVCEGRLTSREAAGQLVAFLRQKERANGRQAVFSLVGAAAGPPSAADGGAAAAWPPPPPGFGVADRSWVPNVSAAQPSLWDAPAGMPFGGRAEPAAHVPLYARGQPGAGAFPEVPATSPFHAGGDDGFGSRSNGELQSFLLGEGLPRDLFGEPSTGLGAGFWQPASHVGSDFFGSLSTPNDNGFPQSSAFGASQFLAANGLFQAASAANQQSPWMAPN